MYSLLIADDEKWIKQRLVNTIDWTSIGISKLYSASNGVEALDLMTSRHPDIILTDIRMPGFTGIELMQKACDLRLSSKFILLSGYAEFEYAQSALRLGAVDYLMKPVKDLAVISSVEKCISILKKDAQNDRVFSLHLDAIQKTIYSNILKNRYHSEDALLQEAAAVHLQLCRARYGCMIIKYNTKLQNNREQIMMLTSIVQNHLSNMNICMETTDALLLEDFGNHFTCIIQADLPEDALLTLLEKTAVSIERDSLTLNDYGISIGFGRFYSSPLLLHKSYDEALTALRYRIYTNNSKFYNIDSLMDSNYKLQTFYPENMDIIALHIKNGKPALAQQMLTDYMDTVPDNCPPADYQLLAINTSNTLIRTLLNLDFSQSQLSFIPILLLDCLELIYTRQDILRMFRQMIDSVLLDNTNQEDFTIQNILTYIRKNYRLPLTSKSVAEEFHYNPSYFSKLFSDEVGQPFTKYLANLRVDKSKELLKKPGIRISEIATKVGFEDYQYFARTFKQYTGVSPSIYREHY